jgi:hypothetical protein
MKRIPTAKTVIPTSAGGLVVSLDTSFDSTDIGNLLTEVNNIMQLDSSYSHDYILDHIPEEVLTEYYLRKYTKLGKALNSKG